MGIELNEKNRTVASPCRANVGEAKQSTDKNAEAVMTDTCENAGGTDLLIDTSTKTVSPPTRKSMVGVNRVTEQGEKAQISSALENVEEVTSPERSATAELKNDCREESVLKLEWEMAFSAEISEKQYAQVTSPLGVNIPGDKQVTSPSVPKAHMGTAVASPPEPKTCKRTSGTSPHGSKTCLETLVTSPPEIKARTSIWAASPENACTYESGTAKSFPAADTRQSATMISSAEANVRSSTADTIPRVTGTRYRLLDVVRGVTLLNMMAYHLLYDLVYIFGVAMPWYISTTGYVWQQAICWTFIFLSGISCNFSHGNAARGARLLLFGAAMTLVTWLAMPEQLVVFGVLSLLGCSGIIYALLEKSLKKISAKLGLTVSMAAFLFTKGVPSGFVGVGDIPLIRLPNGWYSVYAMFPVGFPTADFYSSDYFSIVPWIFLYFAGFFFWRALRNRSPFELRRAGKLPVLELIGRNTLPIYLAHQPLIYGVLWLIFRIMRN